MWHLLCRSRLLIVYVSTFKTYEGRTLFYSSYQLKWIRPACLKNWLIPNYSQTKTTRGRYWCDPETRVEYFMILFYAKWVSALGEDLRFFFWIFEVTWTIELFSSSIILNFNFQEKLKTIINAVKYKQINILLEV